MMDSPSNTSTLNPIPPSKLPDPTKPKADFLESSFFAKPNRRLPSPAEVKALSRDFTKSRQQPVVFEHLNLIVKLGRTVTVAEAQCLWMLRRVFGDTVPVPEIYGWRTDEDYVFIYMELIDGRTLHDA
ncbi:hypothetical protein BO94DRAFT_539277 [Aspergillus sclerotioniger CBS 115572]|uniref:Aminoglycoside phosphotransferase domain-containing protein n=1 Tax=Aspergillus sclerotioniger CBS 115572 TaxID=1450535 RepID=A0A317VDW7_9EURO|nr:hypothetical protein BO94DRAFT_539277 [Aspergillus sclerotioniger CBS 115572]PWY72145.1 hypothetical protein BO94DRAFT_539277 [Aspergillus sclerotioniger CBS 115572]